MILWRDQAAAAPARVVVVAVVAAALHLPLVKRPTLPVHSVAVPVVPAPPNRNGRKLSPVGGITGW